VVFRASSNSLAGSQGAARALNKRLWRRAHNRNLRAEEQSVKTSSLIAAVAASAVALCGCAGTSWYKSGATQQDFAGAGAGAVTCAEFTRAYAAAPQVTEDLYYSWALGFMTGLNVENPDNLFAVLNATSQHDETGTIRNYCDAHPPAKYIDAVLNLYLSMPKKPLPAPSPTENSH
jgi:hypothetical protein